MNHIEESAVMVSLKCVAEAQNKSAGNNTEMVSMLLKKAKVYQ